MKLIVDTNFLVAASLSGDAPSSIHARAVIANAHLIAIPTVALCEFFWVMRSSFAQPCADVLDTVKAMLKGPGVVIDMGAVASGMAFAEAGGDFADGVIAFEGQRLGGEVFASFDRTANRIMHEQGFNILPAPDQPLAG